MSGQTASPERARVFFALWPEAALAERLAALAEAQAAAVGGRAMARETLHLTLAFLGDVALEALPALQEAGRLVARQQVMHHVFPLEFSLDHFGYWQHNHLAWIGCRTPVAALHGLADALAAAVGERGFALEPRPFVPHVTLVRRAPVAPPCREEALPLSWRATDFALLRSRRHTGGAAYETLARWPAEGSA